MKVAFHTLGCKVNQYETEAMAGQFREAGFTVVPEEDHADCYVINSCTVTNIADRKTRQFIRRAKAANPKALVCVTGCYSQVEPETVWNMPEADIVIGTGNKNDLVSMVLEALETGERRKQILPYDELTDYRDRGIITSMEGRVRAFIKIEEGCDRFCAYCLIPFARGRVRSRDPQEILEEAKTLIAKGFREIVLTGINTALYGTEDGFKEKYGLTDTVETGIEIIIRMLDELPGDFRIRLSSLEPTVVDKNYVKRLLKYKKLTPHLHLSIQSGSDRILKAMGRRYSRDEYLEIVKVLKEHDEGYGVTTDIIVGFPGETEEDLEDSLKIVSEAGFLKVHAFKYSRRKGTRAYDMADQVPGPVKNDRIDRLMEKGEEVRSQFLLGEKGRTRTILCEEVEDGWLTGYTENYVRTYVKCPSGTDQESLIGQFITVVMKDLFRDGMTAEPIDDKNNSTKGADMADCIFCMLANHEIPTNVVYEDDEMFCFKDMDPQAPVHVLLIPKKHIESLDDLKEEDAPLLGRMMVKIQDIAKDLELDNGYRVVSNNGEDAFQTVKHLHFHILGKRKMTWPPG